MRGRQAEGRTPRGARRIVLSAAAVLASFLLPGAVASAVAQDAAHQQFLFAYKLLQRGDDTEAAAEFEAYLQRYPQAAKRGDAVYYRALLLRRAGKHTEAAELLASPPPPAKAPQLVPGYAVDLLLGQVLSDLGRYPEALASLEKIDAGTLDPSVGVPVWYLRGRAYQGAGNLTAAAANLTEAAGRESPMQAAALLDLARVRMAQKQPEQALETLTRALARPAHERTAEAARFAGDVAYDLGNYPGAIGYYDRVITGQQTSIHYAPAVLGKLWALYAAKRYEPVITAFEQLGATLPQPERTTAAYLAGSAHQQLTQHEQAVLALEPVSRVRGESPLQEKILYRLAVSQHALGRHDAVAATVKRLHTLYPDSALTLDAGFLAASSAARTGGAEAGAAELTRFVERGPDSPYYKQALLQRAQLYEQHGRPGPALDDYEAYLQAVSEQEPPVDAALELPVVLRYAQLLVQAERYGDATQQLVGAAEVLREEADAGRPLPQLEQETLYRLGVAQTAAEDYDAALSTLNTLRNKHPLHAFTGDAELKRGAVLKRLGREREALESWIAAADDPHITPEQRVLALRTVALTYRDAGQAGDAAVTLRRAAAVAGADGLGNDELLWLARYELDQGDAGAARSLLAVLDATDRDATGPQRAERLYLGGLADIESEDDPAAEEKFGRVIALGEGFDLDARLALAQLTARGGRTEAALAELADLSRVDETVIAARAMLEYGVLQRGNAAALRRQGNTRAAIDALADARRAIKKMTLLYLDTVPVQPAPQRGLVELAEIAAELNEPAVANREYAMLVEHFPGSAWGRYAAAVLAWKQDGRPDDALAGVSTLLDDALDAALRARAEALRDELERLR